LSQTLAGLTPARATAAASLLLLIFLALAVGNLRRMTLTTDEAIHYSYGLRLLHFESKKFGLPDAPTMPFSMRNAAPQRVVEALRAGPPRGRLATIEFGRYATVVGAVLLGWLIFRWAGALYGPAGGLLALTVFVFDPNMLAHSGLVTTDLYAAWTICWAVWGFWRVLNHEGPGKWRVVTVGAAFFGLAQIAKYSSAYLVPILLLTALGHAL